MKKELVGYNTFMDVRVSKVKCDACHGTGTRNGKMCVPCGGEGWVYRKYEEKKS